MTPSAWQRWRYSLWSPLYDVVIEPFSTARRRSLDLLNLQQGERVLIPGIGTGADLPLIPAGVEVSGTDVTPAMLRRAADRRRPNVTLKVMDASELDFPDAHFDAVVLHLILAVMDQPARGLREAARVLRPGGRIVVFDKFLADRETASLPRRLLNVVASFLFTDINRRFGDILAAADSGLEVAKEEPAGLNGVYRIILLRKPSLPAAAPQAARASGSAPAGMP